MRIVCAGLAGLESKQRRVRDKNQSQACRETIVTLAICSLLLFREPQKLVAELYSGA